MGDIIEIAKKRDEIMTSQFIYCPECGEKQFSPFDKLYTSLNDKCVDCSDEDEVFSHSNNIFEILESL